MPHVSPLSHALARHYLSQTGGGAGDDYPVFRGAPYQYGSGFGSILKTIGRFLFPIAASAAKSFISSAASGLSEGKSIKEAARGALGPAIESLGSDVTKHVASKVSGQQGGKGKRRKSKRRKAKKQVYKRVRRSPRQASKRKIAISQLPQFNKRARILLHPTNF